MPDIKDGVPITLARDKITIREDGVKMDGEYEGEAFKFICCDCGLVHDAGIVRNVDTGEIFMLMSRNERSTAQHRRHDHIGLHKGVGKWKLVRVG